LACLPERVRDEGFAFRRDARLLRELEFRGLMSLNLSLIQPAGNEKIQRLACFGMSFWQWDFEGQNQSQSAF
jgi:hypothetical protein